MKISFMLPGLVWRPSGSYLVVFQYANHLVERGHDVDLVFVSKVPEFGQSTTNDFRSMIVRARRRYKSRIGWFDLDPRVKSTYIPTVDASPEIIGDAVVATTWQLAGWVASLSPQAGRKYFLVYHYEGDKYGPRFDAALNLPMTKIAISHWTADRLLEREVTPVRYVPTGVALGTYRCLKPIEGRPAAVVMNYVAKEIKDPHTGLQAAKMAKQQVPGMTLKLFGVGRPPPTRAPWISYSRRPPVDRLVSDIYNESAVVLGSSREEGFGFPLAEGAACGCAIVSTDSGGIGEFAVHEESALLSPPGDPDALGDNLSRLLHDEDLRHRLISGARVRLEGLTWASSAAKLERVLQDADS